MATAIALKEQGNTAFRAGDYKTAEELYSKAIQKDSSNPSLYTNRAFSRIKLQAWDSCIDDCLKAIELQKENMKGWYYLAQAQIALHHPNEAYHSAIKAYEICLKTHDSSATNISTLILQAKKEKWEAKERDRIRRRSELLRELEDALEEKAASQIEDVRSRMDHMELNATEGKEEIDEIQHSSRLKIEELRNIFAISDPENLKRREVPDYLIDNITFAIMHDPVVTKTGNSYDKSTLLEHLRRSNTDPLAREPLTREDLRPNLALKQACAEFLEENGWAVDW